MCPSWFRKILPDRKGNIAILTALTLPIFVGGLGLGSEVGYWYMTQRMIQNAADVAAYNGAVSLRSEKALGPIQAAAQSAAANAGFKAGSGTITTNWPAVGGSYSGDIQAVEVTATENLPRMFTALFLEGTVPVSARAVARVDDAGEVCILALDPLISGAVTITGSSIVTLDGCNVHSNSVAADAVDVSGAATAAMPCVSAVGEVAASAGLTLTGCKAAIEHAAVRPDPFADLPDPLTTAPCEAENNYAGKPDAEYTLNPGRYCGGLSMKRIMTLNPGIYVIDGGDLSIVSGAQVAGTGITFFLTNGAKLSIAGTASVTVSAPTSGTYAGVLAYVDRDDPDANHIVNGNSSTVLNGAIYAPSAEVRFAGSNSTGGGCTQIVAKTVQITGDSGLGANCSGLGYTDILAEQLVMLVE
ncbi:MAG: pilus assembly protein TadG-related protein [Rhodospirillales bacterium]